MENSAYAPNPLPPPALVVFSQAGNLPDALRMQRPFNTQVISLVGLYFSTFILTFLHLNWLFNLQLTIWFHEIGRELQVGTASCRLNVLKFYNIQKYIYNLILTIIQKTRSM